MITVAAPNPAIGFLEEIGFFTFLSYLLIFIVLYYIFKELFEARFPVEKIWLMYMDRLKSPGKIRMISVILSLIVTVLIFFWTVPYASTGMSYVAAVVFIIIFAFVVVASAAKIMGLDLIDMLKRGK